MPQGLPKQLEWARFVRVLNRLGYRPFGAKSGSSGTFHNPNGDPPLVTFHEPHNPKTLARGTLREYVRKLQLTHSEFLTLLPGKHKKK